MHSICHMDIPSKDFEKAKKFYGTLFNWKFNLIKEWNYMLFDTSEGVGGGFDQTLDPAVKSGFIFYVEVEDVAETLKNAAQIGGKVIKEKTQISPEYGYFGLVTDLEGNQVGLWSKK